MRLYITLIISAFYGCTTSEIQTASFAVGIGDKLLSTPEAEISPPLFAISPEPFSSAHVAVADDGQYLIAYQDRRGDDSGWRAGDNVRVARMAKNGRLLDRGGIEIAFSGPSRQQVFVASDGVDYLVAWVRTTDYEESKIVFARLGHDGRVLQGPTDVRAVKNVEHIAPQVCFDGHDYAMVFGALDNAAWRGSVHAARISKQGRVLSVSELPTTAGKEGARVAIACRKGSLIAWSESDLDSTVLRMLAWPQQQPLPKTSNALSLSSVRQTGWIGLAAGASNFLAVWDEAYTKGGKWSLVGQVVTPAAKRTTPTNRQLSGGQPTRHHPELQYDSKAYRLLMQRLVNNQEQVFAASLGRNGRGHRAGQTADRRGPPLPTRARVSQWHLPGGLDDRSDLAVFRSSDSPRPKKRADRQASPVARDAERRSNAASRHQEWEAAALCLVARDRQRQHRGRHASPRPCRQVAGQRPCPAAHQQRRCQWGVPLNRATWRWVRIGRDHAGKRLVNRSGNALCDHLADRASQQQSDLPS
jgi:hypothetical protein